VHATIQKVSQTAAHKSSSFDSAQLRTKIKGSQKELFEFEKNIHIGLSETWIKSRHGLGVIDSRPKSCEAR
jgi:hypothetical protein